MHSLPSSSGSLAVYPTAFQWGARCITAGGRPNPIFLPMLATALDLILRTFSGPAAILAEVSSLNLLLLRCIELDSCDASLENNNNNQPETFSPSSARYSPIGLLIVPTALRSRHIIGLSVHPSVTLTLSEISQRLEEVGIKTSVRQSYLRISSYLYNTPQQVRYLYAQLRQILISGGRKDVNNSLDLLPVRVPPKILLIGGSAWLGQYVFKSLRHGRRVTGTHSTSDEQSLQPLREYEIHLTYCTNRPHHVPPHQAHQINFSSDEHTSRLDDLLATLKPQVIIHLAAQSSLLKCDRDRLTASSLNCPISHSSCQAPCSQCSLYLHIY
jgi:hypothetical protein